jgi:beta-ketoacyl-acyl-carrier-protein synthase II
MNTRVVVTGIGAVSPIGLSASQSWENALAGVSGVAPISLFDASELQVRIACEVKGFDPEALLDPREARRQDRFEQFAMVAAAEALQQAGLPDGLGDPNRVGVVLSSAIGGLQSIEQAVITMREKGPRRINPFTIPRIMANGAAGLVAIKWGFGGPSYSIASACAAAADAIGQAWMLIRAGVIDVALAGGSEATITPIGVSTFDRLGALSRGNEPPYLTPAPFDLNRDGLVMGEGAGVLVLESVEHAKARKAEILAEVAGYAATADAFHITAPAEDGSGGARAMRAALDNAGINPEEVDYVNAHGTGTQLNDRSETRAIKAALGEHAYEVAISSTKSMTGHMMGATGALESIFCVLAIRHGVVPPTINYRTPDPECDLDYVPNEARQMPVRVALNNAFGFGGHNAVLAFRSFSG